MGHSHTLYVNLNFIIVAEVSGRKRDHEQAPEIEISSPGVGRGW